MERDGRAFLDDVRLAAEAIESFTEGKTLDDHLASALMRSAVERQFEIVGEALNQLGKVDPALADRFPQRRRLIDFRNILAHGYTKVDDGIVWQAVQLNIPQIHRTAVELLGETNPS